jgi:hypothetical protein
MFCSQCGVKASGKFCHQCGSLLNVSDAVLAIAEQKSGQNVPKDWERDPLYENVIRTESVRSVIARHAANAPKIVSGESILAIYDKVVQSPIPLEKLAAVVQPLYASWGSRTGKEHTELIRIPIGRAIAQTLCSLAKHGQTLQNVEQLEDGCLLNADLPSSVCALKGTMTISLRSFESDTQVAATTSIPGQLYDWGKSNRCLQQLFSDLRAELGLPPGCNRRQVA